MGLQIDFKLVLSQVVGKKKPFKYHANKCNFNYWNIYHDMVVVVMNE